MSDAKAEMKLTLNDLRDPHLDKKLLDFKEAKFYVDVEFADGHKVVHAKDLIISFYLWETLRIAKMDPMMEDVLYIKAFNNDVLMKKNTALYKKVLDKYPDFNIEELIQGPWIAINNIFNLALGDREVYVQSSDALDLCLMNQQPELRKLSSMTFPDEDSSPINWNLCDMAGRRVNRGIYVYKASISTNGQEFTSAARKLAVAAQ